LLLKRRANDVWETLVKPGKKLKPGAKITFGDGRLRAEVLEVVEEGNRLVKFHYEGIFEEILDSLGEMPLPPYITHKLEDKEMYRTFNMGIGFVLVVSKEEKENFLKLFTGDVQAYEIGEIISGQGEVNFI